MMETEDLWQKSLPIIYTYCDFKRNGDDISFRVKEITNKQAVDLSILFLDFTNKK